MAPTESSILSNFLLPPAPLPAIISLPKFTELFPRSQQDSPQIPVFYRELQHQRAIDTDDVKRNIAAEVKRGEKQKREVVRARQKADRQELAGLEGRDVSMEGELFGSSANQSMNKSHTLRTILPEMQKACDNIEAEIAGMEAEAETILADIKTTIGDLSDLRYGRFNRASDTGDDLAQDVVESLKRLESLCESASNG